MQRKKVHNPMNPIANITFTHCGARTRKGSACRMPAMKNGRCRLHGGKSLSGKAHGRYKHGYRSRAFLESQRHTRKMIKNFKAMLYEAEKVMNARNQGVVHSCK